MIVHHAAATPLDAASLVVGGSRGKGPAALGLWTCITPAEWQISYGPVLNRIETRPPPQMATTTLGSSETPSALRPRGFLRARGAAPSMKDAGGPMPSPASIHP